MLNRLGLNFIMEWVGMNIWIVQILYLKWIHLTRKIQNLLISNCELYILFCFIKDCPQISFDISHLRFTLNILWKTLQAPLHIVWLMKLKIIFQVSGSGLCKMISNTQLLEILKQVFKKMEISLIDKIRN